MKRFACPLFVAFFLIGFLGFAGCASSPDNMTTASVSPMLYNHFTCDQIILEADRVSYKTKELYKTLDSKADGDAIQATVGIILLWPVLFALEGGDGPEAAEYSRLKGEAEALDTIAIQKKCDMNKMPAAIAKKKQEEEKKKKDAEKLVAKQRANSYSIGEIQLEECAEFTTC